MYALRLGDHGISIFLVDGRHVWSSSEELDIGIRMEFNTLKDAIDFLSFAHHSYPMTQTSIWLRELFSAKKSLKN